MKVRQLTFRLLQVYADVVRTGSITATANRLHLTQPTVSQQLKRLREIVGEPIVRQEDSRVVPTEVGQALYQLSQDLLSRADVFSQYLDEYNRGGRGHFSIGLVNTAQYVLPRLLGPFGQANPQVDVTVEIGNRQQMLNRFERHEDDLYVFSHPPSDDAVMAAPFLSNPLVVVGPENNRWANINDLTMEALKEERFLLREPGSATRHTFDAWLYSAGIELHSTQQIASNEAIRLAVASGMGLAVLSRHVVADSPKGVQELPLQGFPLKSRWHFVVRRERRLPPAAYRFLSFVQGVLALEFNETEGELAVAELLRTLDTERR
ncbi:LysR family transcriptional regulator [Halomonas sp. A40-4]|uniref:LysR family transcriptional regulator n=1 Tax=unclassified Halomonas TaxID=2609666 RepID=UPI000A284453|nr:MULTISPECIES: LysR family transcriptional regulator [unclassified Halomonas]QPL45183.1 LysR family transcriptional regulator [Halomonas sp. A40-4]